MTIVRYAGNRMTGVSGDTKPTEGSLTIGTTFHETNTDDLYMWDGDSWNIVAGNTIAETLSSKTLTSPVINTSLSGTAFLDEDNFASDSATKVASQQSIKAYVASQVPGSQNVFSTIAVSEQDNVVADGATDTVTFAEGSNITITTNASTDTITIAASASSTTTTVTDNESTNENNLITFVANAATATGTHGLEMDGDLHYNPSTGRLTATQLAGTLQTVAQTNITSVGVLDGGSITSNFGSINTGSSAITTTGLISGGSLDIDDVLINGTTIGHTNDTDLMTVASGLLTVAGEISVTTLDIGGTNVTSTAAEINIVDGGTSATGTTLADADRLIVNDNGTMVQVALTDFETYFESVLDTLSNVTTVGVLNAGSITSGFGTIDTGSSNITTTGTISAGNLTVTGTTTTVNSTVMTVVDPIIHLQTASGGGALGSDTNKDVGLAMQYYSGSAKTAFLGFDDSAVKLTFIPDATLSSEVVSGSVGTIVANLEGNVTGSAGSATGNAATATALANARTIGGTSFDGTANIAVGLAATATALATARTIGGTSFDGTANIVPGTSTALATGRTIAMTGDVTWTSASFDGSGNVTGVAAITAGAIVNADVNTSAAIVDTKLATISTADKVAGGAIQIDSGTDGTGITVADTDKLLIDDGGTTKYINASQIKTYASGAGASESFAIAMAVAL